MNATDTTVSLITVGIKLDGGEGNVVIESADELADVPFILVAVIVNEYIVLGFRPVTFIEISG